jgi:hypothetical protein
VDLINKDLRIFLRACEQLLSSHLQPRLSEEEQELVGYYVNELSRKFGQKRLALHLSSFLARADPADPPDQRGTRKMCMKQLHLGQGVLNAVLIGEFELGAAQIQFVELLDESVRSGATKLLIDGQQMDGRLADFERFLYGEFAAWATMEVMRERNIALRFAYVIHAPLRDPRRSGENVAVNRGMDVKTFEDASAAIEWLHSAA